MKEKEPSRPSIVEAPFDGANIEIFSKKDPRHRHGKSNPVPVLKKNSSINDVVELIGHSIENTFKINEEFTVSCESGAIVVGFDGDNKEKAAQRFTVTLEKLIHAKGKRKNTPPLESEMMTSACSAVRLFKKTDGSEYEVFIPPILTEFVLKELGISSEQTKMAKTKIKEQHKIQSTVSEYKDGKGNSPSFTIQEIEQSIREHAAPYLRYAADKPLLLDDPHLALTKDMVNLRVNSMVKSHLKDSITHLMGEKSDPIYRFSPKETSLLIQETMGLIIGEVLEKKDHNYGRILGPVKLDGIHFEGKLLEQVHIEKKAEGLYSTGVLYPVDDTIYKDGPLHDIRDFQHLLSTPYSNPNLEKQRLEHKTEIEKQQKLNDTDEKRQSLIQKVNILEDKETSLSHRDNFSDLNRLTDPIGIVRDITDKAVTSLLSSKEQSLKKGKNKLPRKKENFIRNNEIEISTDNRKQKTELEIEKIELHEETFTLQDVACAALRTMQQYENQKKPLQSSRYDQVITTLRDSKQISQTFSGSEITSGKKLSKMPSLPQITKGKQYTRAEVKDLLEVTLRGIFPEKLIGKALDQVTKEKDLRLTPSKMSYSEKIAQKGVDNALSGKGMGLHK